MAVEITIPRLGWSMEEGTFVEWLKRDGEAISPGDALFVMEGDKAAQEIESLAAGTLHIPANGPQPGDTIQVGAIVGYLLQPNEAPPVHVPTATKKPVAPAPSSVSPSQPQPLASSNAAASPAVRRLARELAVDLHAFTQPGRISENDVRRAAANRQATFVSSTNAPRRNGHPNLPRITPRAARMAQEQGIDWSRLTGSGRHGRIRACDLPATSGTAPSLPREPGRLVPLTPIRRTIAQRLQAWLAQVVPVTLMTKIDAGRLVMYREAWKSRAPETLPSYNDIIVHSVAQVLKDDPALNASWTDRGVYVYDDIHVVIAVDTDAGLLTPILRNTDSLSLEELARQSKQLAERARTGKLTEQELSGGTFTVTNLGRYGIDAFTPVINPPQAAILGVGRIIAEPVVVDNQVGPGYTLTLSLTFDHRVMDGAPAARWLQCLAARLEDISPA